MAKFNPERWKPSDDSSPGYRTLDPKSVVLKVTVTDGGRLGCPCGCGEIPLGTKAVFCMGHDARLRGILIRAHLMGVPVRYWTQGVLGDPKDAYDIAAGYYWKSYLDDAAMRREGANRDLLRKTIGSDRLVKVGRWEYTGQVVAVFRLKREDMVEVKYINKAGDEKTIRVPAAEAPVA